MGFTRYYEHNQLRGENGGGKWRENTFDLMAVFKYVTVAAQATRPSLKMPVKVHTRKNRTLFRLYLISPGVHCTDGQRCFFFSFSF